MAKQRTIDPRIWQHKAFLRSPWHCRDVFFYLFSAACDDEGRFDWDPLAILEGAFPRAYPVTEDDVIADLQHLVNEGLALRYGDADEYGFLCGWFEHQYIQADRRTPSSLPEPPVRVPSWAAADGVRDACAKHLGRGLKQVTYHDAIDWLTGRERSVNGSLTERSPEVEVEGEVESKGNDSAPPAADAPPSALVTPPEPAPKEKPKPTRKPKQHEPAKPPEPHEDTPSQAAANACLALYGLTHQDLGKSAGKYFAAIGSIIKQQTGGAESVLAWAQYELANGQRALGSGADPVVAIPIEVRAEVTAGRWQKTFTAAKEKQRQNTPAPAYDDPQEAARREYAEQHDRLFGGVR